MTSFIYTQHHKTPIGELLLGSFDEQLCVLNFAHRKMRTRVDARIQHYTKAAYHTKNTALLQETKRQIDAYLNGKLVQFDLPIKLFGSTFQQQVWSALQCIKYGETASYLEVAHHINHPKAVRAVANANGANALSLIIPCHRIIAHDGSLGGYGGGLPAKKKLLVLEKSSSLL